MIGSTCIGASVVGGVCNSSGGSLVRRGPAFTRFALFARVDERGQLELVNHIGIDLPTAPEAALSLLDSGLDNERLIQPVDRCGHAHSYEAHVRDTAASTPARFNADPRGLHEAAGSAGKVMVFAVRLDTFPVAKRTTTFYLGTNDPSEFATIRKAALDRYRHLPVSAEYIHRDAYRIAAQYGKDVFLAVQYLGTKRLGAVDAAKRRLDRLVPAFLQHGGAVSDRLAQWLAATAPKHLPRRMEDFHARYEHHLILTAADDGIDEAADHLAAIFPSATGDMFVCTPDEAVRAARHRFAAAAAAVRYRAIHHRNVEDIVAIDVALPRNAVTWAEPPGLTPEVVEALHYGHFFCHVFHRDYVLAKGADTTAFEHGLLVRAAKAGAKCPAEHNVGHLYQAEPMLLDHYRSLDPTNRFNPGIGCSSKLANWS